VSEDFYRILYEKIEKEKENLESIRIRDFQPSLWVEDAEQKIIIFPEHIHQLPCKEEK